MNVSGRRRYLGGMQGIDANGRQVFRLEARVGYLQFLLRDAEADMGAPDEETSWEKSPEEWRIGVEQHAIFVATARYDYVVPVLLELLAHAPAVASLDAADHVVEADIDLPSGRLAISAPDEGPEVGELFRLAPGRYRLRISFVQTDRRPSESPGDGPGDYLDYQIMMWPVRVPADVKVLKQGRSNWAYE